MARRAPADTEALSDHRFVPADSVDRLVADWHAVRPDLDFSPVTVVSRLGRARAHLDREIEALFAREGISAPGFAVLVTLARLEAREGVSQRRLMGELGLTSGTVSVRIDRLVADGLVERRTGTHDRRNTQISLTERGRELFERIVPEHLDNERRLLSALTAAEQGLLGDLLRKLLVEFEGSATPPGGPALLGLALAPAHVTIAMRRAVGLPPVVGLLVRGVDEGGPAAAAGLQTGDVLVRAGRRGLSSVAALLAAIAERPRSGVVDLTITRGVEEMALPLALAPREGAERPAGTASAGRMAGDRHRV